MATLQEYYNTGDDDSSGFYNPQAIAQTFTPTNSHSISSVKLKIYKVGNPGILTFAIKATSGGLPTGADLCSNTTNGDALTTNTTGEWIEVTFGSPASLTSGTKYAIVLTAPSSDLSNRVHIRTDITSPSYSGGSQCLYNGSIWTAYSSIDCMFECWGDLTMPEKPINPTPEHEGSGIGLNDTTVTWENGGGATSYNIYYGTLSGFLSLVAEGVTDLEQALLSTPFDHYGEIYYWRVDAVNDNGVTQGDEWSFTTLIFDPILPTGITLVDGEPTGTPTGENNVMTVRRLVAAARNKIWYEDV